MKTILFLEFGTSGYGGSFQSLYQTIGCLDKSKFQSVVFFFNKTHFYEKLRSQNVHCYYIHDLIYKNQASIRQTILKKTNGFILKYFPSLIVLFEYVIHYKSIQEIKKIGRNHRADLLHLNNQFVYNFMGLFIAKSLGIPCVCHLRTFNSYGINSYKCSFEAKLLTYFVAISQQIKNHWVQEGLPQQKIEVVYNIFEPEEIVEDRPIDHELPNFQGHTLIFVGRLIEGKGIDFLLSVFKELLQEGILARLVIVGSGPDTVRIQDLIHKLDVVSNVLFLGYQECPQHFIQQANVLILPSEEEGFGRVLLEAMHVDTPVIGTNVGGIPEVIDHGQNGMLVPYGDVTTMKETIINILIDEPLKQRLIQGGRESLNSKFLTEVYKYRLESIYYRLLQENKK